MIILLGDSQSRALVNAYAALPVAEREYIDIHGGLACGMIGPAFSFSQPFWLKTQDGVCFSTEMQPRFTAIVGEGNDVIRRDDDREFIFSIGAQPSLLHAPGVWNSHTSGKHVAGLGNLSLAAFRVTLLHYNRYVFGFFNALKELNVRFSVMAEPPPSMQFAFIQQKGDRGLELWRRHARVFRAELDKLGIPFEAPPSVVFENDDEAGCLRLPLCDIAAENSPHANSIYGRIFLRSMLQKRGMTEFVVDDAEVAKLLEKPETLVAWHIKLGFSLANMRKQSAVRHFREALAIHPENSRAMFGLAYALERTGATQDAEEQYEATLALHPRFAECWGALAAMQVGKHDYPSAHQSIEHALALDNSRDDWKLRRGSILERLNRLTEARDVLYNVLATDLESDIGLTPPTEIPGGRSLTPEPDPYAAAVKPARVTPPYLIILGRIELAMKNIDFAERCFNLAISLDSSKLGWQAYLGDVHFERGDWAAAAQRYAAALEQLPHVIKYSKRLGLCQEKLQQLNEAQQTYLNALAHHPNDRSLVGLIDKILVQKNSKPTVTPLAAAS